MTDTVQPDTGTQELVGDRQQEEKMLPQSEVDKIVHARTRDVAIKSENAGYQRALNEFKAQQSTSPEPAAQNAGHAYLSPEEARQIYADERRREASLDVANQFLAKLDATSPDDPPERWNKISEMKQALPNMPDIVYLANSTDNVRDVMLDLWENPKKIADIRAIAQISPQRALVEMQKLSNSIKANNEAAKIPKTEEPLSQPKASVAGADSGSMTARDWKEKYKGRY